jgi:toxin ParE1/3/4
MQFAVLLTNDAARDLEELHDYIALNDAPGKAEYVFNQIEKAFSSLSVSPDRGVYPRELLALGIREYRKIFFEALPHHLQSLG